MAIVVGGMLLPAAALGGTGAMLPGEPTESSVAATAQQRVALPRRFVELEGKLPELEPNSVRSVTDVTVTRVVSGHRKTTHLAALYETSRTVARTVVRLQTPSKTTEVREVEGRLYLSDSRIGEEDGGRPWVACAADSAAASTLTPELESEGPRQGLEELDDALAGIGNVREVGEETVDGESTFEFVANRAERLAASHGEATGAVGDARIERASAPRAKGRGTRRLSLHLYVASDGVPVLERESLSEPHDRTTVRAVGHVSISEAPISVTAPPASKTIGEREWKKLGGSIGGVA